MYKKFSIAALPLSWCLFLCLGCFLKSKEQHYSPGECRRMYNNQGLEDTVKGIRLKELLGVNAFEWNFLNSNNNIDTLKVPYLKAFGGFRHYLDWHRLETKENVYAYQPALSGLWGYDDIYNWCKLNGITVLTCIKTIPDWLQQTYPPNVRNDENAPLPYGMDKKAPASYKQFAKLGFQFAARYGSNANVDTQLVSVAPEPHWAPNQKKIGLGLVKYIECNNEPDRTWKGENAHQSPEEYAANLSAFYDGHMGSLGPGVGVKNADPNMQVVMGGIASPDPEYINKMIDWCRKNRGLKKNGQVNLCFDVINYHYYSFAPDEKSGQAPEISLAPAVAAKMIRLAREKADSIDVWITELGYDINPRSPLHALPIKNKSVVETQADWILRSSLLYARCGIKRLFYYMLEDVDPASTTQFASSGFVENGKRRPVVDYFMQVKSLMGDYFYKTTISYDPFVDIYTLNGKEIYILTIPDERGRELDYDLNIDHASAVRIWTLQVGQDKMLMEEKKVIDGKVRLKVTETPLFVEKL